MTGNPLALLFQGEGWVNSIAFSPDGQWLAGGLEMGEALVWELHSGRVARRLTGHQESILSVAFSPDSRILATGGQDSTARLWSVETGRLLATASGHKEEVSRVAFWPQERLRQERLRLRCWRRNPFCWRLAAA